MSFRPAAVSAALHAGLVLALAGAGIPSSLPPAPAEVNVVFVPPPVALPAAEDVRPPPAIRAESPPAPRAASPAMTVRPRTRAVPRRDVVVDAAAGPAVPAMAVPQPAPALAPAPAIVSSSSSEEEAAVEARALAGNPPPAYPVSARRRGQEGRVLLRVVVDSRGGVAEIAIVEGSGFAPLDEAALEAVREWRFAPARRAGHAVEATVRVPVIFRLRGA